MDDHEIETEIPPYKCGIEGVFPMDNKNDNNCVVEFTRFSIKSFFDINHDWDVEIVKPFYNLCLLYKENEIKEGRI